MSKMLSPIIKSKYQNNDLLVKNVDNDLERNNRDQYIKNNKSILKN